MEGRGGVHFGETLSPISMILDESKRNSLEYW